MQQQLQSPRQLQAAHAQARPGAEDQGREDAGVQPPQQRPSVRFRSALCIYYEKTDLFAKERGRGGDILPAMKC